jgi:hypothetical protein
MIEMTILIQDFQHPLKITDQSVINSIRKKVIHNRKSPFQDGSYHDQLQRLDSRFDEKNMLRDHSAVPGLAVMQEQFLF